MKYSGYQKINGGGEIKRHGAAAKAAKAQWRQ